MGVRRSMGREEEAETKEGQRDRKERVEGVEN